MKPTLDEVDDAVDEWHNGKSNVSLREYLGWTHEEYVAWVKDGTTIPNRPLPSYK